MLNTVQTQLCRSSSSADEILGARSQLEVLRREGWCRLGAFHIVPVTREGYEHSSSVALIHQTSTPNGTYRSALHRGGMSTTRRYRAETDSQGTGRCDDIRLPSQQERHHHD